MFLSKVLLKKLGIDRTSSETIFNPYQLVISTGVAFHHFVGTLPLWSVGIGCPLMMA